MTLSSSGPRRPTRSSVPPVTLRTVHIELPADHRYVSVDREMIVALGQAQFRSPTVARVTPLDGGRYNSTFRLEFAVEAPLVLRIAPAEHDQRPSERHLLRNEVAGIPLLSVVADLMPATLVTDFSHAIIPRDYVVQSWLPGTPASRVARSWDSDALARLWRYLGAILRRIHSQNSPHARNRRATRAMTEIERD